MAKKGTVLWLSVLAVSFFLLGLLAGKLYDRISDPVPQATYAERLAPALDLTAEQHRQLLDILGAEDRAIDELMAGEFGAAMRHEIQKIRQDAQERIEGLLDETQKARYRQMLAESPPDK